MAVCGVPESRAASRRRREGWIFPVSASCLTLLRLLLFQGGLPWEGRASRAEVSQGCTVRAGAPRHRQPSARFAKALSELSLKAETPSGQ